MSGTAEATWKNRIVGQGAEDPHKLLPNPENWRLYPKNQQDGVAEVLEQVGWVQQVIKNARTGRLIDYPPTADRLETSY